MFKVCIGSRVFRVFVFWEGFSVFWFRVQGVIRQGCIGFRGFWVSV